MNWKVRLKNKAFWMAMIPSVVLLVTQVAKMLGYEIDLTTFQEQIIDIVGTVFIVLTIIGVVNDPTTAGLCDSTQAMTYEKPKESE